MKFNRYQLIVGSFLSIFLINQVEAKPTVAKRTRVSKIAPSRMPAQARNTKKKTVGELLSQASQPSRGAGISLSGSKAGVALPSASLGFEQRGSSVDLSTVKPPKSSELLKSDNPNQSEYLKILDQQINELFKLTRRFKNSENRGELWLRLAELYVEKSIVIDGRKQDEYDQKLRAFQAKKTKIRPKLDTAEAREFNRKAIQLYEWFQRDFPKDEKNSQALFFLGYNYFETGDVKKGAQYYQRLTQQYPDSPFTGEAHFSLGEYYFENEQWAKAYKDYAFLIKQRKHRLHTFSLYKGAWCLFRLGKNKQALSYLEYIIKSGRAETGNKVAGRLSVNRNRLESEALRDLVVFYAESGTASGAAAYFRSLVGGDISSYLEKLAYQYADRGNKEGSKEVFKLLISENPNNAKAFEYQYQIVQNYYYGKNIPKFKDELYRWVKDYGPSSSWFQANKSNRELIENSYKLRETTLRNYVLQQHQTAQNSRASYSQGLANDGYQLYLANFGDAASAADMRFYYGELLYDTSRYDEAAVNYKWIVDNAPQSKFYGKAAQNLLLSVERSIPSDQEMQKRIGNSLERVTLDPQVERFIKSAQSYVEKFPTSEKVPEIKFRIGRLYYQSNHFDEATKYFKDIVQKHSSTKHAQYSANLLLDIYNLRKDYAGLAKTGAELLAVPSIANSKAGADIRGVLEKASFKKGQDLEVAKKYGESAQVFEGFAKQNPSSSLATIAFFNAGVNFERAGQNGNAIESYKEVLKSKESDKVDLRWKAKRLLAKQYQDSAQFEESAKLYRQASDEKPKDSLAANLMYNAAVMYEAMGRNDSAVKTYTEFIEMNKKRSETRDARYAIAQIHRKAGRFSAAILNYQEYLDSGASDQERVIESNYWIGELSAKINRGKIADDYRRRTLAVQKHFAPDRKGVGATYAAKIKLQQSLATFREMKSVSFPRDASKQKAAVDRKIGLLTRLTGELTEIIKYDSAEEVVSALGILGEANLNMGQAMLNAPLPAGLNAEETKQYKAGIEKYAEPFMSKAREGYKAAVERGWDLETYNESYKTALEYMNKLDPKAYYDNGEVGSDTRLVNWISQ